MAVGKIDIVILKSNGVNLVWKVVWILQKIIKKTPHGVNHEVFRNVDIIVLINVLRQLTSSNCSHICKRLKSQQLRQLRQFSKNVQKRTPRKVLFVSIVILSN